jgi:cobalt-zinc-cadmium efflux system protein
MHDAHQSHGDRRSANRRRLAIALGLAASYLVAEVVGGLLTGSLALLADAAHMASDVGALTLALFASWMAARPAGRRWTYGFVRVEVLAALAQGAALVAVAILIVVEALERMQDPQPVIGGGLLIVAAGGLVVNLLGLWILNEGRHDNLNMRGAWLHVASDALGSVGAMTAGFLVWQFGWMWADPVASLVISALVLMSAWTLLRDALDVLMEAAPRHLDPREISVALERITGVRAVHDLHVWTVGSSGVSLSCHLVAQQQGGETSLLTQAYTVLGSEFGIDHATIQVESPDFAGQTPRSCAGGCEPGVPGLGRATG